MPRAMYWAALAACLVLPVAPADAQIGDSSQPLDIEADHVDVYDAERRIVWTGNVNALQGTSSIRADRIEVFFDGEGNGTGDGMAGGWGDINRIVASDNVFYITPSQRARGNRGVYLLAEETVTLTGEVVITQGENVITANRFVTNLATGNSTFGSEGDGERVRSVIIPSSTNSAPSEPDGDAQPSN